MLYTAKCYWPGINAADFDRVASVRLSRGRTTSGTVVYRGTLLFPDDGLVLCLFDAPSRGAVKQATERARVPCERIIESVWVPAPGEPVVNVEKAPATNDLRLGRRNR
jgi:hypothetical protein